MTIIVADTTSSLPLDLAASLGIPMIPQLVIFGENTYRDDTELSAQDFLDRLKSSSTLPKTAAPPPALYNPIFEKAAASGETVLVVVPTGKLSGTLRSAQTARQDFPSADIRIIDTGTIAGCLGALVLVAHEMAQQGFSADEIEATLVKLSPHAQTYFVVDTLEYLQKGGRIGAAKALLGELLQVKPILQIKDGAAAPFEQERTKKRATARLIEIACERAARNGPTHLCVMHIDALNEARAVRDEIARRLNIPDIPIYLLPAAIVVHAGPKALAVSFFGD